MRLFGLILLYVSFSITTADTFVKRGGVRGDGDYSWFWHKNFTDGSKHDNDPDREFFRGSTILPHTDDYWDERTTEHEEIPETTPEDWYPYSPSTYMDSTTTTTEKDNEYYRKRKHLALTCAANEEHILEDENGCQLCTCNGQGAMWCSRITCGQSDHTPDTNARDMVDAVNTNLIMREYATGCKKGRTVQIADGKCTCKCVLPSVLSCPKSCFYSDEVTTEHDHYNTADYSNLEPTEYERSTLRERYRDYHIDG